MIKPKSIQDFLDEDSSLTEKITYEKFMDRQEKVVNIKDDGIEEAYGAYRRV